MLRIRVGQVKAVLPTTAVRITKDRVILAIFTVLCKMMNTDVILSEEWGKRHSLLGEAEHQRQNFLVKRIENRIAAMETLTSKLEPVTK